MELCWNARVHTRHLYMPFSIRANPISIGISETWNSEITVTSWNHRFRIWNLRFKGCAMLSHDQSIRKVAETLGKVVWQTLVEVAWLCYRSNGQIPWEVWICCSSLSRLLKCRSQRWQVWATRRWTSRMWRFMLIRLTVFSHLLHLTFFSSKTVHPATKWIVYENQLQKSNKTYSYSLCI